MNLEEIIILECDPTEFCDRLNLTIEELVHAFSLRIYMQEDAFEDLMGVTEVDKMYDETEHVERDAYTIEEDLTVRAYEDMEQLDLFGDNYE